MTKIAAIIPARMGSSRFPGKPIAPILGKPMIEHVYRRCQMCSRIDQVILATCDEEIRDAAHKFGAQVVMTSDNHERASDRAAEAAEQLDADMIVMVQGDEPMTRPEMLEQAIVAMEADDNAACVNMAQVIDSEVDYQNRNVIKVVTDLQGCALYFSRSSVPTASVVGFKQLRPLKQICTIPFRRDALRAFARLAPSPLEIAESIDMMRFLENGMAVRIVETEFQNHAVDTPADLEAVEKLMRTDPLCTAY